MLLENVLIPLLISLYGKVTPPKHATEALDIIEDVVQTEEPLFTSTDPDDEEANDLAREKTARLLVVFAKFESNFQSNAVGDGENSYGILQVNRMFLGKNKPEDVLKSPRLGIELGLEVMRYCVTKCGSIKSGLGAYASGKCNGAPKLVSRRCVLAGLTANCE